MLELATVLHIQITGIIIVKSNSNSGRRASRALGVHGISRVLLFDIQQCACCAVGDEKFDCAMYPAVSVATQKNGELLLQPICYASGMTSSISSPGFKGGNTYTKFQVSASLTTMRQ